MIQNILVLGAGSAGLIAAITLKRKIPTLSIRVARSPELGVIGVRGWNYAEFSGAHF